MKSLLMRCYSRLSSTGLWCVIRFPPGTIGLLVNGPGVALKTHTAWSEEQMAFSYLWIHVVVYIECSSFVEILIVFGCKMEPTVVIG